MNCPNCRQDNSPTTRFCTCCGAVLVENTPDGRRRRVLRPWGMGHAPLTESPAMPDVVIERSARGGEVRRRVDVAFIGGVLAITVGAMLLYPRARAVDAPVDGRSPAARATIAAPLQSVLPESYRLSAPAMSPVPQSFAFTLSFSEAVTAPPRRSERTKDRRRSEPAPVAPAPSAAPSPPPQEIVPHVAVISVPRVAPPVPVADRWQPLKDRLQQCSLEDGIFRRATCEQGARLAHCDGFWGLVDHCPAGRTEYGQ